MHDPQSETTSEASSEAAGNTPSSGSSTSSPTAVPMAPALPPPTGRPVVAETYQWPRPAAAPMAPVPPPAVAGQRTDTYRGLAIAGFALSVLAVIGVLLLGLGFLDRGSFTPSMADSVSSQPDDASSMPVGPLTGTVPVAAGKSLPGDDLANAVEQRLDDGSSDITMDCPKTRKVAQGVVTVCHGQIDDEDWAVVVYFEDELGTFTLNLL
ncbi:hypothetical protein [Intrasporangium mesophilum]